VMANKVAYVNKISRANHVFIDQYARIGQDLTALVAPEREAKTLDASPLYHLYRIGADQIAIRFPGETRRARILSAQSIAAIRSSLDAGVVREAGDRYPGFYRFAKVLERTARGIQSGAIPVPGGRQKTQSRQTDPLRACRELAAAMDLRMCQLTEEGVPTQAIIGRMTGHLPDLQKVWTTTTDDQLATLCREYPGFYRYASLMEEAATAESQKSSRSYDCLPELPAAIKEQLTALLGTAAKLERDCQSVLDAGGAPAPRDWLAPIVMFYAQWTADLARFKDALQAAGVPQKSHDTILPVLDGMAKRIGELEGRARAHLH